MTSRPTFTTERLRLRPATEDDFDLHVALGTNPDVMRYIQSTLSVDDIREVMPMLIDYPLDPRLGHWTVELLADGTPIGDVSLGFLPMNRADIAPGLKPGDVEYSDDIELGYLYIPDAWGKGYASEAATRLLAYAFGEICLDKVVAVTDPDNAASQHVLKKIGMRHIGNRYAYGGDGPGFEILNSEWQGAASVR